MDQFRPPPQQRIPSIWASYPSQEPTPKNIVNSALRGLSSSSSSESPSIPITPINSKNIVNSALRGLSSSSSSESPSIPITPINSKNIVNSALRGLSSQYPPINPKNITNSALRGLVFRNSSFITNSAEKSKKAFNMFYNNIKDKSTRIPPVAEYLIMLENGEVVNRQPDYKFVYRGQEFYISPANNNNNWIYVYIPDQPSHKLYNVVNDKWRFGIIGTHYSLGFSDDCTDLFMLHKTEYSIKVLDDDKNKGKETLMKNEIKCNMDIQDIQQNLKDLSNITCKLCNNNQRKTVSLDGQNFQNTFNKYHSDNIRYILQLGFTNKNNNTRSTSQNTSQNKPIKPNKPNKPIVTVSGAKLHSGLIGGKYSKKTMQKIYKYIYSKKPKSVKTIEVVFHSDGNIVIMNHYTKNKVTVEKTTYKAILKDLPRKH
jgi:hypothetical protein